MPGFEQVIGGSYSAYIPDDDRAIELGYTEVRIYWGSSESGSFGLATSLPLVAGQKDYTYNNTAALAGDWAYHTLFGATPGESPASEPVPIGPPRSTRLEIRRGVGDRLNLLTTAAVTASVDANTVTCASLIDLDASEAKYANRFARAVGGNVDGETRRVRSAANSGYVPASGNLNFGRDFSTTPDTAVTLELWRPERDQDPSVRIDNAMQRARHRLWWQETFYLSTDSGVTEYAMPANMLQGSIQSVEYAANSFPEAPGWSPVGAWDLDSNGGQPTLTVLLSALGASPYSQGTVIRIRYNTFGDRMDNDEDYWNVPLEWAIAEVAYEYLRTIRVPSGGKEDVSDAGVSLQTIADDLQLYRTIYMPRASVQERGPR